MKASVIIPTRNRAAVLDACLYSLQAQTCPAEEYEVIVVDNGSTDSTPEIVAAHANNLQLRYEAAPEPGLHVGRHVGLRLARSDVLVYGDDDIIADETWISTVIRAFADPMVALVGGNNIPHFEQAPPEWLLRWWEQPVAHGQALASLSILDFGEGRFDIDPAFVWGCNFSIRRQALLAAGGFHPDAMPADRLRWRGDGETHVSDWIRRSGMRTLFDSGASVRHRVDASRLTPDYFERRAFAQGVSDSYTDTRRTGRPRASITARYSRLLHSNLRAIRMRWAQIFDAEGAEFRRVQLAALDCWQKGYHFHQSEVRADPLLFAWVTKESYL